MAERLRKCSQSDFDLSLCAHRWKPTAEANPCTYAADCKGMYLCLSIFNRQQTQDRVAATRTTSLGRDVSCSFPPVSSRTVHIRFESQQAIMAFQISAASPRYNLGHVEAGQPEPAAEWTAKLNLPLV